MTGEPRSWNENRALTPIPVLLSLTHTDQKRICSSATGPDVLRGTGRDEAPNPAVLQVYNITGAVCVKRAAKCPSGRSQGRGGVGRRA